MFAWLTSQPYFRDLTNFDIRQKLYQEKMKQMDDELPPLPMLSGSSEESENPKYYRSAGLVWESVDSSDNISYAGTYRNWRN